MLRFGSVLLAGLLVLSGCSQSGSSNAEADRAFSNACAGLGVYGEDTILYDNEKDVEGYLVESAKLNSDYLRYLEMYLYRNYSDGTWPVDYQKMTARCLVVK